MEDKNQSDTATIFKWFKEHVLDSKIEPNISHHELVRVLSLSLSLYVSVFCPRSTCTWNFSTKIQMQCTLLSLGGKVKDAHISLLINAGLLVCKQLYHSIHSLSLCNTWYHFCLSDTPTYWSRHVLVYHSQYWQTVEGSAAGNFLAITFIRSNLFSNSWWSGKEGATLVAKAQASQRDVLGPAWKETTPLLSSWYEISHSWSHWLSSPQNFPNHFWSASSPFNRLTTPIPIHLMCQFIRFSSS